MKQDILIGGLMALGTVLALLTIVAAVARRLRETAPAAAPAVTVVETATALPPASGW
jgi:hypothetical protein